MKTYGKHVVIGIISTWNIKNYRYVGDVSEIDAEAFMVMKLMEMDSLQRIPPPDTFRRLGFGEILWYGGWSALPLCSGGTGLIYWSKRAKHTLVGEQYGRYSPYQWSFSIPP